MRGILGADVFINLLLVFIIATGLLLMNTNKAVDDRRMTAKEGEMPPTHLPKSTAKDVSGVKKKITATLTARQNANDIKYFLEQKPIKLQDLQGALRDMKIQTVRVRFDERIPYGRYVDILDLCTKAGIKDIRNVYKLE